MPSPQKTPAQRFADARNYLALAHQLLGAATAGDRDAAYYLWRLMSDCDTINRFYFQRHGQPIGLDEAQQRALERHMAYGLVSLNYERCHGFAAGAADLGDANDWLVKAANAGQPAAESEAAHRLLIQQKLQSQAPAGAGPLLPGYALSGLNAPALTLLRDAVRSGVPDVLFQIGDDVSLINPDEDAARIDRYAWWLVACERGVDCTQHAEWVQVICANDARCGSFTSPSDLVQLFAEDDWPAVQSMARLIDSALARRDWDHLPDLPAPRIP